MNVKRTLLAWWEGDRPVVPQGARIGLCIRARCGQGLRWRHCYQRFIKDQYSENSIKDNSSTELTLMIEFKLSYEKDDYLGANVLLTLLREAILLQYYCGQVRRSDRRSHDPCSGSTIAYLIPTVICYRMLFPKPLWAQASAQKSRLPSQ